MRRYLEKFIGAILGGISIGLGGTLFLMCENKIIGSILFVLGLFTILNFKYSLFTGEVSKVIEEFYLNTVFELLAILIGNLCGAWLMSFISRVIIPTDIISLCITKKLNTSYIQLFLLAMVCNMLIYIGVRNFKKSKSDISKYIGLVISVSGFVLIGAEHSIADMFYFSLYGFNFDIVLRLIIIILGNICGGIIIPLIEKIKGIVN